MLTDAERESLCANLQRTAELAVAATQGLSEAQWNFRPEPEAWPIAHIAEHIAVSEAVVFDIVQKMLERPAEPERSTAVEGKDRIINERVPHRGRSAPAPEPMRPTGRYPSPAQVSDAITTGRQRTIQFVRATGADLRSHFEMHPALQLLDAYQWLLLVGSHTERHVNQIMEWKNPPATPMREIRVAAAQFETRDGDKQFNLAAIERLAEEAAARGAEVVSFHEVSIPGYTWLETLTRDQIFGVAEEVPDGPSVRALADISRRLGIAIGAGLIERSGERIFNCYAVVDQDGFVARHHKLHAFIHPALTCGEGYTVFDLRGCRFGILTCYDNNLPENVRLTAMLGAEIVLMPHVTGCLPSPMPGRGTVDPQVWHNRERDPVRCRQEFDGPKGRGWIMRWLPARAWENGIFAVYSNPIGVEGGTIKPGGAMILDPFGEVMEECRVLGDGLVVATLDPEKRRLASGESYIRARRPELYGKMVEANPHLGPDRRPDVWWQKHRTAAGAQASTAKPAAESLAPVPNDTPDRK